MGLRKVGGYFSAYDEVSAKIYYDTELSEYVVKFYKGHCADLARGSNHLTDADYFTNDLQDAQDTASSWIDANNPWGSEQA